MWPDIAWEAMTFATVIVVIPSAMFALWWLLVDGGR